MRMEANARNWAIRVRAALLLVACAVTLVLPVMWQPGTSSASPDDPTGLVVVAAGWVAWALTIYLALGTGASAASYLADAPRPCARFAPRALRRAVEVAVGASGAAAVCLAPAVAYADGPSPVPVTTASPLDWPGLGAAASPRGAHVHVDRPGAEPQHPQRFARLVVRAGDSLWSLTARDLGTHATPAQVAAGWPRLYAANRRAIGADPNLIHPGQRLVPPTSEGTPR
jgi:nucleoid-associated protein YgaU